MKKQAKQARAIATVEALVEAGIYILSGAGRAGFTANKVAEKAGVNIASFYQYFPNKEALLFHIAKLTWERQLARLSPILTGEGTPASRLRAFIRAFFVVEAEEAELRRGLRGASVELRDTAEFKALIARGRELFTRFVEEAVQDQPADQVRFTVDFVILLITSFAERTTDEGTPSVTLQQQADLLTDMLTRHFAIEGHLSQLPSITSVLRTE